MEGACPSTRSPFSGGLTKHGLQYIEILILLNILYAIDLQALALSLHLVHL